MTPFFRSAATHLRLCLQASSFRLQLGFFRGLPARVRFGLTDNGFGFLDPLELFYLCLSQALYLSIQLLFSLGSLSLLCFSSKTRLFLGTETGFRCLYALELFCLHLARVFKP